MKGRSSGSRVKFLLDLVGLDLLVNQCIKVLSSRKSQKSSQKSTQKSNSSQKRNSKKQLKQRSPQKSTLKSSISQKSSQKRRSLKKVELLWLGKKVAVLLDFVQIASTPPPQHLDNLYHFFLTPTCHKFGQGCPPPSPSPNCPIIYSL